jgi:hypothetical protein
MANRRFIDFPIAASVGNNDIVLIWQDGLNKQTTKATLLQGSPQSLAGLTDVDIAGLINGQILQYNSTTSKWENVDRTDINLSELGDVTIVAPANGQVLVYNSSTGKWENSSAGYVPYTGAITTVNLGAQSILAGSFVKAGGTAAQFLKANGSVDSTAYGTGSVTSVALTMPTAFSVAGSPVTTAGTLAVTGAGTVGQYIRGDGSLADFPATTGGGSSVSYYLNGSVSQGTIGGVAYKELNRTPVFGAGTDISINANGYIASFITDAGDPNKLLIPAGNWNFETYFSANSNGGSPSFYIELYKYNGSTFTLIASSSTAPELIAFGTSLNPYFSTLAVPETVLALTDRLALRYYVTHSGRTITLHTENGHLCQVITTFTTGLTALNGLTNQVQFFAVGTSGTDFAISSASDTHTFNLPTASATNRGALSSGDWTTFNNKTSNLGTVTSVGLSSATSGVTIGSTPITTSGTITLAIATASGSQNGLLSSTDWTTFNSKQPAGNYVTLDTTQTITGQKTISRAAANFNGTVQSLLIDGADSQAALTLNSVTTGYAYQTFAQNGVGKFELGIIGTGGNGSFYINRTVQTGETGASIYIKKADGFVGINNITPTFQLHVNGTSRFTNVMSIDAGAFATEALVLNSSTNQQYIAINSGTGFEAMTKYNNPTAGNWYTGIRATAGLGTTASYHIFSSTYGNDVFVLNTDGTAKFASIVNVGTTASTVYGTLNVIQQSVSAPSFVRGIELVHPNGTGVTGGYIGISITGQKQGTIQVGDDVSSGNLLLQSQGGNVGIGTSNTDLENGGGQIIYNSTVPRLAFRNSTSGTTGLDGTDLALVSSDFYIFNREAGSIIFGTSGTDKMRIFLDGNVFIGTSPSNAGYKLDVNGTGRFSSAVTITASTSQPLILNNQTNDQYLFISSASNREAMTQYFNATAGNWYTGIRTSAGLGTTASYHIYSSTYGNDVFAINTDGNSRFAGSVGIGVAPSTNLHVEAGAVSYGQVRIKSSGAIGGETSIHYGRTSQTLEQGWTVGQGVAGIENAFGFYTGGSVRLGITTGGNVMIGTTTDTGDKLRVNGTTFTNEIMTLSPESESRSGIVWRLGSASIGTIVNNRRLRVKVGGVEYYIGAVEV